MSRNTDILENIVGAAQNVLTEPQSRIETILQYIYYDIDYDKQPQSRIEEILLAIKTNGSYTGSAQSRNEAILIDKLNGIEYTADTYSYVEELLKEWTTTTETVHLISDSDDNVLETENGTLIKERR